MIRYALLCEKDHEFESWFNNSDAYDSLQKSSLVECPHCGSSKTRKALMTPQISKNSSPSPKTVAGTFDDNTDQLDQQNETLAAARKIREHVKKSAENVGDSFAREARKIHDEEAEPRGIYGKATLKEARDLIEDDIPVLPLPDVPEDKN